MSPRTISASAFVASRSIARLAAASAFGSSFSLSRYRRASSPCRRRFREVPSVREGQAPLDEPDDARRVAPERPRLPERRRRRDVAGVRLERRLVALDRAVLVAARVEETRGAHELLRLRLGRSGLRGERLDRAERRVGIARQLAQPRERFERAGVPRRKLEDLLVGPHRSLGRADLLGEDPRARGQELDLPRVVAVTACACFASSLTTSSQRSSAR